MHQADEAKQLNSSSVLGVDVAPKNKIMPAVKKYIPKLCASKFNLHKSTEIPAENQNKFTCQCQIVRSSGQWSMGLHQDEIERSIQMAYIDMINKAEHFIYIENQFFVSSSSGKPVRNRIAEALIKRLERAIEAQQDFKLVIVLPLLPGFEGDIDEKAGNVMRIQLGWLYHTIARGKTSILEKVLKKTKNSSDYIKCFGLRNHGVMKDGKPATELIYIHSKLIIIDDKVALIGSANINDRSQMGSRDSEIAVVVEDQEKIQSMMNGKPYEASKFAYNLRKGCFKINHGFTNEAEVSDPLDPAMWAEIDKRTKVSNI